MWVVAARRHEKCPRPLPPTAIQLADPLYCSCQFYHLNQMILKGSMDPGFDWAVRWKSLSATQSDGMSAISGAGLVLGEQLEL